MAPQGGRGGLGWVILAVALAVPGFLFYNWWSHLKAEHDRGVAAKARSRADGAVFQAPPAQRLVNPIAPSTATAAPGVATASASTVPVAGAAPAGLAALKAAAERNDVPPGTATPPGGMNTTVNAPTERSPAPSAAAAVPAALSTAPATITLSRDPMMSPMDLVRIREEDARRIEEAERLRREAEAARHPHRVKRERPKEKPVENAIELQGIVATPSGTNLAIVNGATVNEGEAFEVEGHSGRVKVVRITAAMVTFEYKKRIFKMTVSTE